MAQDTYSIEIKPLRKPSGFIRAFIYFWYLIGCVAIVFAFYWHYSHGIFGGDIDQLAMQKVKNATYRLQRDYVVRVRYKNQDLGVKLVVPNTRAYGTGFFVSTDGYLVTCHHLVYDNSILLADEVKSVLIQGASNLLKKKLRLKYLEFIDLSPQIKVLNKQGQPLIAKIVEDRPDRDITLLQVNLEQGSEAEKNDDFPIPIGETTSLVGGESLWAVGFPTVADITSGPNDPNFLVHTVNKGTVSAIKQSDNGCRVLQSDAEMGRGMSGGPVVNAYGQLVGVTSFGSIIKEMVEKAGYAIASDEIKYILRENSVNFVDLSE